ncbi:uncharacterized protein LOC129244925 [Anastrepha obliqua]|uniref:uncharacterized protein LOC129244925 n=1 Tax=Anastrepha obliqua TaxID=95512 RepID=UPI0024094532|nr:uncharacterized protein LOC129244925 [Anastrepha obliqua]
MTHSYKANFKISSISQLKNSIQNIVTNVKQLEELADVNGASVTLVNRLMQQTDDLLVVVENSSLERFANKVKKRRIQRKLKKLKRKQIKTVAGKKTTLKTKTSSTSTLVSPTVEAPSLTSHIKPVSSTVHPTQSMSKKLHNHHYDAQRFLRTFELLKMLHFSRGRSENKTREFAAQLHDLRATWSKVLKENTSECSKEKNVEDQWTEVFFGPAELSYYGGEQKISDFLRVRHIWDSYLTHSKHGSCIHCGWVLPHENSAVEWQEYRFT